MNEVPTAEGGPGFLAFLAFFLLALALWFLMRNMNARMRRMSYRQQAAHRGKDDPQAAPEDLAPEDRAPGDLAPEPDGPGGGPEDEAPPAADDGPGDADAASGPDEKGAGPGQ